MDTPEAVIAVALAADGGFDAGLGQAFGVANAEVLRAFPIDSAGWSV